MKKIIALSVISIASLTTVAFANPEAPTNKEPAAMAGAMPATGDASKPMGIEAKGDKQGKHGHNHGGAKGGDAKAAAKTPAEKAEALVAKEQQTEANIEKAADAKIDAIKNEAKAEENKTDAKIREKAVKKIRKVADKAISDINKVHQDTAAKVAKLQGDKKDAGQDSVNKSVEAAADQAKNEIDAAVAGGQQKQEQKKQ